MALADVLSSYVATGHTTGLRTAAREWLTRPHAGVPVTQGSGMRSLLLSAAVEPLPATVVRVVDGDTVHLNVRLGSVDLGSQTLGLYAEDEPVRLNGCNAAAKSTASGAAAMEHLTALLPVGTPVTATITGDYKYGGEIVADVTLPDGTDLVQTLIAGQWAAPWDGRGKQPSPPWPRTVTP